MKKSLVVALLAAAMVAMTLEFSGTSARAQTPVAASSPGTPPIGRLVDIRLVAWPLATAEAGRITGTLIAMTDQWLIVKDGTFEHWVPKEKVMDMKASR